MDPVTGSALCGGQQDRRGLHQFGRPPSCRLLCPRRASGTLVTLAASPIRGDMGMDASRLESKLEASHLRILLSRPQQSLQPRSPVAARSPTIMSESFAESTDVVVVNDVYTLSPRLLNQATFSWNRTNSSQVEDKTVNPTALGINLPQYPTSGSVDRRCQRQLHARQRHADVFLEHELAGQGQPELDARQAPDEVRLRTAAPAVPAGFSRRPSFTFNGTATGNATADFLLGVFNSGTVGFGVRDTNNNTNFHGVFFQDEFKVQPAPDVSPTECAMSRSCHGRRRTIASMRFVRASNRRSCRTLRSAFCSWATRGSPRASSQPI